MAQLQTLKDRESGQTVYPITSTEAVFDENGVNLKNLLLNQKQSIENTLKDYPKKTDVTQSLEGKQDKLSPTTDIYITNDNIIGLSAEFKNSKLDKSDWDARNDKFTIRGKGISQINGQLFSDSLYSATEFIPINRNYDITVIAHTTPTSAALALYNRSQELIGCRSLSADTIGNVEIDTVTNTYTLHSADIPTEAMYFRCSSSINQPNRTYSNGPTNESRTGAISNAIVDSKFALFIDLYNAAFKVGNPVYGKYDPENAPDPQHPFYGNTLWMTYEEAVAVYTLTIGAINTSFLNAAFTNLNIRTHLPFMSTTKTEIGMHLQSAFRNSMVEVVNLEIPTNPKQATRIISDAAWMFQANKLHTIIGIIEFQANVPFHNGFGPSLINVQINKLYRNIDFRLSSKLSLESFQFLISNAVNTTAITITVHPDTYAKLTDESNEDWHQVLLDAAEKQITFATV